MGRVTAYQTPLSNYLAAGQRFFSRVVTGEATIVYFNELRSKHASQQWLSKGLHNMVKLEYVQSHLPYYSPPSVSQSVLTESAVTHERSTG